MNLNKLVLSLFLVATLSSNTALAWGSKGHQIVAMVGAEVTSGNGHDFWSANRGGIRNLSTVPDRVWKDQATKPLEAPTHWFQADAFTHDPASDEILSFPKRYSDAVSRYGQASITENGTGPWRIVQLYRMSVEAFKKGDARAALEYAGAMSHYIGDLAQPLHVTENYNGQKTGNAGIHGWFETQNIGDEKAIRGDVARRTEQLLRDPNFQRQLQGDLMDVLLASVARSMRELPAILANDDRYGRNSAQGSRAQLDIAIDRMADGAAVLSAVLDRIWRDAGVTLRATPIPLEDPRWIPIRYDGATPALMTPLLSERDLEHEDDCSLE